MRTLQKRFADEIIAHALEDAPNECCGILAGADGVVTRLYRITNTAHSPFRYVMDPQEQLGAMLECDRNGWDIMAFYHSHTHSPAHPSQTDVRMALQSGYLDEHYVLVSLENADAPAIRSFKIDEAGNITEHPLDIT